MGGIFKRDYLAGNILKHLFDNPDKSYGVDNLLEKFKSPTVEISYLKREIKFLVSDGLLFEENIGNDTRYNADVPVYAYRINNKGISFVIGLIKDNKALRNSKIAMGLSVAIPLLIFIAGKSWDYRQSSNLVSHNGNPCEQTYHSNQKEQIKPTNPKPPTYTLLFHY